MDRLNQPSTVSKRRSGRITQTITHDDLQTLKHYSARKEGYSLTRALSDLKKDIDWVIQMLFFPMKKSNNVCKNYGHILDQSTWKNGIPSCGDCGADITAPEQLRKTSFHIDKSIT